MRCIGLWTALTAAIVVPQVMESRAQAAAPDETLTVVVDGVHSANGSVLVTLCSDPAAAFPGGCRGYAGAQKAANGQVVVTVAGVPPGRYALQAFHDENANGRPDTPPEGFAFGNDANYPPAFDAAAITVGAATRVNLHMQYPGAVQNRPTLGSHGAAATSGVDRIDVRDDGLYGELYVPRGAAPPRGRPAIVLLGGSEGGLDTISQMATSFAEAGYAALALAYWNEQGLPAKLEGIPLEYFDRAIRWAGRRREVDAKAIALLGWSRGAEAVLLVGSRNPHVRAVVAVAPSGIVWQGMPGGKPDEHAAWTVGGRPLPFVTPDPTRWRPDANSLLPLFEARMTEADARPETAIPVERIRGPVLLISGGKITSGRRPGSPIASSRGCRAWASVTRSSTFTMTAPGTSSSSARRTACWPAPRRP